MNILKEYEVKDAILHLLSNKSDLVESDIAAQTDYNIDTVIHFIKKLEAEGYISVIKISSRGGLGDYLCRITSSGRHILSIGGFTKQHSSLNLQKIRKNILTILLALWSCITTLWGLYLSDKSNTDKEEVKQLTKENINLKSAIDSLKSAPKDTVFITKKEQKTTLKAK